ncbi:hypothetical protein KIPB_012763, partial [Kipferlia bialata]
SCEAIPGATPYEIDLCKNDAQSIVVDVRDYGLTTDIVCEVMYGCEVTDITV